MKYMSWNNNKNIFAYFKSPIEWGIEFKVDRIKRSMIYVDFYYLNRWFGFAFYNQGDKNLYKTTDKWDLYFCIFKLNFAILWR